MVFRGRENALKFCSTPKENNCNSSISIFRYSASTYREVEILPTYAFLFWGSAKSARYSEQFRDPLNMVQKIVFHPITLRMISAFQKCSKFENRTNFGKTPYPKGNVVNYKYSLSDMVLENLKWATLMVSSLLFILYNMQVY